MDAQPFDYGSLLRQGQAIVPDFAAEMAKKQLMALQQAQLGLQVQQAQQEQHEAQAFDEDLDGVLANPNADAYARLILRHPKQAEKVKAAWSMLDDSRQKADLTSMGEIYSAAANGRYDLAAASLKRRIDANRKAGHEPDPDDTAMLSMLESGDPEQQKKAVGMGGLILAAITGPDKFASTFGALTKKDEDFTLGPGMRRYAADGSVIASSPFAPREVKVGEGDTVYEYQPGGGAGGQPGAPAPAASGTGTLDPTTAWEQFILPHEGGYAAKDGNGAPVNFGINQGANPDVDVASLTPETAKALFVQRYWKPSGADKLPAALAAVHADTYYINPSRAEAFLKQSGGDPNKYMSLRETWMKSLVAREPDKYGRFDKAWTQRNADLRLFSQQAGGVQAQGADSAPAPAGGPRIIAQGAPKAQPKPMTPEEVAAEGLDPHMVYYRGTDGVPKAVSGQSSKENSLKPWPAAPLTARAENQASITNIDNALKLLDPKNKSPQAVTARNAIGIGTGALGDQFTQYNDPRGADFRALLGQIGGVVIKDISGAAVTAAEDERLKKWVPRVTDRPETAAAKLRNMRREIAQRNAAFDTTYSPDQGYREFQAGGQEGAAPVRVRSIQEAQKLPAGTLFTAPNGQTYRKK